MADYKIPNLCGASEKFNAIQSKLDTMIDNAIDGLEVDASASISVRSFFFKASNSSSNLLKLAFVPQRFARLNCAIIILQQTH